MKTFLNLVLIGCLILMSSCAFDTDDTRIYDQYKVEVNTYLNIRANPKKSASIVGTVKDGDIIDVASIENGWAKVMLDGKSVGYVSTDYLTFYKARNVGNHPMENVSDEYTEDKSSRQENTANKVSSDLKERNETEQSNPEDNTLPKNNVRFVGEETILSENQKETVKNSLTQFQDYTFVINTVRNVATDELFDYAPDLLDGLTEEMDSQVSWWKRLKSWFGGEIPSSNLVLISYIEDKNEGGLLQAECNGNSLKYVKMKEPEKYFRCQAKATDNPLVGIIDMAELIVRGGEEYKTRSWTIRIHVNTGDILENICNSFIVENILPRNSFWHKWVFGWIFAWPLAVANWLMLILGSYTATLIFFLLLMVTLQYIIATKLLKNSQRSKGLAGLLLLLRLFIWLSMISLIIYMFPDLTKVFVMKESGYSVDVCRSAVKQYLDMGMPSNWLLIASFILGTVITVGIHKDFFALATLPSNVQKTHFRYKETNITNVLAQSGVEYDIDALRLDDKPYLSICLNFFSGNCDKIWPSLVLAFVFSGALLLYASVFLWTITLQKIIYIIILMKSYRKQGLYK